MEIVHDIKLNNGEVINRCYFVEYQRKIKNGYGSTMIVLPDSIRCFVDKQEVLNKDFHNAEVLKIYDDISGLDVTEKILDTVQRTSNILGYDVSFPISRGKVIID